MYAVIETGGKQYRVEVGTELQVELLDVEPGRTITLDRVLLVADGDLSSIGRPLVPDAAVSAEVVRQIRGEKLISFKYRPKARSRVKKGHRQELTVLRISDITLDGKSAATSADKAKDDAKTERQRLEEAATAQAAKDAELAAKLAVGSVASVKAPATGKAAAAKGKPTAAKPTAAAASTEAAPAPAATTSKATASAKATAAKPTAAKPTAAATRSAAPAKTSAAKPTADATRSAAPAKAKAKAKAEPRSSAAADPDETPKRIRAKAVPADAAAKAAAPKRSRATKKDE